MLVRSYMTPRPFTVGPKESLTAARHQIDSHGVRQLPVVHDGLLVGIITDRDLRDAGAQARLVEEVMTQNPITIDVGASVDEGARLLRQSKVNALPVVKDDALVGILSTSDVLDAFVALTGVAEPTYRLVVDTAGDERAEESLRPLFLKHHAEVLWMQRGVGRLRNRIHVRLRSDRLDDLNTALDAAGYTVLATVASCAGTAGAEGPEVPPDRA